MTEVLKGEVTAPDNNATPSTARKISKREKDEMFWTELEIRRLGNVVAECINSRRYVGDDKAAEEERKLMRTYIEAMKRKSTRVLHRAELYAQSGHAHWPGIDPTISDPVSLAEEYVRVVENYEAVLSEEESRAKTMLVKTMQSDNFGAVATDENGRRDGWELDDDLAYQEALRRERGERLSADRNRKDLLGDAEGLRRRKGDANSSEVKAGTLSQEDEELMARHQPIQDELTSNLVDLVGQLKESINNNNEKLKKDSNVLDETEDAVDKNLAGIENQRTNLKKFSESTTVSWWLMMVAALVIVVIFVLLVILMRVPL